MLPIQKPDWILEDDNENTGNNSETNSNNETHPDPVKLANLLQRHKVYGDITQNATESQIKRLLVSKI